MLIVLFWKKGLAAVACCCQLYGSCGCTLRSIESKRDLGGNSGGFHDLVVFRSTTVVTSTGHFRHTRSSASGNQSGQENQLVLCSSSTRCAQRLFSAAQSRGPVTIPSVCTYTGMSTTTSRTKCSSMHVFPNQAVGSSNAEESRAAATTRCSKNTTWREHLRMPSRQAHMQATWGSTIGKPCRIFQACITTKPMTTGPPEPMLGTRLDRSMPHLVKHSRNL